MNCHPDKVVSIAADLAATTPHAAPPDRHDQIDDHLIGDLAPTPAAHLAACSLCAERVAVAPLPHLQLPASLHRLERAPLRHSPHPLPSLPRPHLAAPHSLGHRLPLPGPRHRLHQRQPPVLPPDHIRRSPCEPQQPPHRAHVHPVRALTRHPPGPPRSPRPQASARARRATAAQISADNHLLRAIDASLDPRTDSATALGLTPRSRTQPRAPHFDPGLDSRTLRGRLTPTLPSRRIVAGRFALLVAATAGACLCPGDRRVVSPVLPLPRTCPGAARRRRPSRSHGNRQSPRHDRANTACEHRAGTGMHAAARLPGHFERLALRAPTASPAWASSSASAAAGGTTTTPSANSTSRPISSTAWTLSSRPTSPHSSPSTPTSSARDQPRQPLPRRPSGRNQSLRRHRPRLPGPQRPRERKRPHPPPDPPAARPPAARHPRPPNRQLPLAPTRPPTTPSSRPKSKRSNPDTSSSHRSQPTPVCLIAFDLGRCKL